MSGSKPSRNAVPSESFGYMQATFLLFGIRFHMGTKQPWNSFRPKKNTVQYLITLDGFTGLPPSAAYHDSHGTTVDTQGTPCASQAIATLLVVSGVEVVRIMSAWSCRIRLRATWEARLGLDWLSLMMT